MCAPSPGVESTRCETMEDGCVYRYYVAVDLATGIQPIHVEYDGGECSLRGNMCCLQNDED